MFKRVVDCLGGLKTTETSSNKVGSITTTGGNVGIGKIPNQLLDVNGVTNCLSFETTNVTSSNIYSTTSIITALKSTNIESIDFRSSIILSDNFTGSNISSTTLYCTNNTNVNTNFSTILSTNSYITNISSTNTVVNNTINSNNILSTNISSTNLSVSNMVITGTVTTQTAEGVGMIPTGTISMWGSTTIPNGYLLCDGAIYLRTSQQKLFNVIGPSYGSTDNNNFKVPDFRGLIPVGLGTSANTNTLGFTGGSYNVALTINQLPRHSHTVDLAGSHNHTYDQYVENNQFTSLFAGGQKLGRTSRETGEQGLHQHTVSAAGGNQVHENSQPTFVLNFIIKT